MKTVTQLTNSGLRQIDYASGRANRIDVAARRAVMTGVSQLSGKISEMNAEKLGTEHFEVEWHAGARPTHAVWQGRVYSKEELTTVCGLGTVTGLLGANCYHMYYPFVPGISVRNWTDEWLEEQNRKENTPKSFNGKEYTLYEAKQRQRQMETCMRAQREKVELLKKGDADPDDIMIARAKYQGQLNEYSRFCKKMGLTEERERIYYDMRGRVATNSKKQNARYAADMIRNADRDSKQYYRYKNILGDDAGNLADFRQMKYNEPKKFSVLKKKVDTYSDIDKKEWSSEFKQKSKDAYVRFEKEGIYLSVHALSRLPRLNKPGYPSIEESDVLTIVRGNPNYSEGESKLIFFDLGKQLVVVKNKETDDIVSIVRRKMPKEVWERV
ncbi:phage minor capsid protein [[Ruminococcus] torques]|uniref:phage minor capsid protein n=1 Tax=[Ruminococcus] torques TaxID=33039 RepID=UPI002F40AEA0